MRFIVRTNEGDFGPITSDQLRHWAAEGRITPNDLVRLESEARWNRADAVTGLFPDRRIAIQPPGPARHQAGRMRKRHSPKSSPRVVLALLLFLTMPLGFLDPRIPIWTGAILIGLVLLYSIPFARPAAGSLLRVYPNKPVRRALKLSAVLVSGTVLVFAGFGAGHVKEEMRQIAEQRAEAEAERQRQTDEANREVEALVREAESLLEAGQAEQAVNTLSEAMEISKASNRHLASHLQTKIADSSDPERLFEIVVSLPNAAFDELKDTGATSALDFGFEVLNDRATELVEPQLVRAGEVRAARERERITAAEARRKREAEERERQRLAEEARRAEELARQGEERARAEARREQAQQEVQDRLDAYLAVLALAEVDVVERVSVQRISGNIWEATLTVKNIWHVRHKQLRLQDAQALWEAWAVIASPDAPDSARIKIVDLRGNPVGGSRVWAGSLIWVDD